MLTIRDCRPILLCLAIFSLSACVTYNEFEMGESSQQIKEVQILDPEASVRHDGLLSPLDGQYGQQVMKAYRKSKTAPKEARSTITSSKTK